MIGSIMSLFSKQLDEVSTLALIQRITKRAEDLDSEEQASSFVSLGNIETSLASRDSRIIFGRRGTGKTHVLSYIGRKCTENGDIALNIDLRRTGSNNSMYSNENIAQSSRATTLLRDLLAAIADQVTEILTDPSCKFDSDALKHIEPLYDAVKEIRVAETFETTENQDNGRSGEVESTLGSELSPLQQKITATAKGTIAHQEGERFGTAIKGAVRFTVETGSVANQLERITKALNCRIFLLLDEWSSIPESVQPFLADFIRRAFIPVPKVTVQIAAIEYRSRFRADSNVQRIGLELGSDISADIDLDDFFVYDNDASLATDFFSRLLFKHIQTFAKKGEFRIKDEATLIQNAFSQKKVFSELVRASEGVPRDFINIAQIASTRSVGKTITMPDVYKAAKDWFERDKQRNIDTQPEAQELLAYIRDTVINKRRVRAFLLETGKGDRNVEFLFDERIVHIARRNYSAQDNPGVRYQVWKVDYGCYVDLIGTTRAVAGMLNEGDEAAPLAVPSDDFRAVRRAILDLEHFYSSHLPATPL